MKTTAAWRADDQVILLQMPMMMTAENQ